MEYENKVEHGHRLDDEHLLIKGKKLHEKHMKIEEHHKIHSHKEL